MSEVTASKTNAPVAGPAFELAEALPSWCQVTKRSPTLDGTVPLRAAQFCPPFIQGNEAGFQVWLQAPIRLRSVNGSVEFDLSAEAAELVTVATPRALEEMVALAWSNETAIGIAS